MPFQAKGTQILEPGWSALFPKKKKKADDEEDDQSLPAFEKGETGAHEPFLREEKTNPPKHYTENSLLGAMEAAGKFVEDDTLREALKERGIGTPALMRLLCRVPPCIADENARKDGAIQGISSTPGR